MYQHQFGIIPSHEIMVHLVAPVALNEHLAVAEGDERKLLLHQLGNSRCLY